MQDFCPLCTKNGNKVKIKAYQLNLQEAVFMCSSEKCTWPVGYQDIVLLNRPVGKEWSKQWDDFASKHLKNELDLMLEFLPYTPPQTPGTESNIKDATGTDKISTVVDKSPISIKVDDFVNINVNNSSFINKPEYLPIFDDGFDMNFEPVCSIPVANVIDKSVENSHSFLNENNDDRVLDDCRQIKKLKAKTKLISSGVHEGINSFNYVLDKNEKTNNSKSLSKLIKPRKQSSFKLFNKKKAKSIPYEKFDFDKLIREKKSTKNPDIKIEILKVEKPNDNLTVLNSNVMKEYSLNELQVTNNDNAKEYPLGESSVTDNKDIEENINDTSTGKDVSLNVTKSTSETCNPDEHFDIDLFLSTLTPSSKDSESTLVDQTLLGANESDFNLDDLLAGFTNELQSKTTNDGSVMEERQYTDSLFA